jgi:hypothetical protein
MQMIENKEQLEEEIDDYIRRGLFVAPHDYPQLRKCWRDLWNSIRRNIDFDHVVELRRYGMEYFLHQFPGILETHARASVNSHSGRRKVPARDGAFGMMGSARMVIPKTQKKGQKRRHSVIDTNAEAAAEAVAVVVKMEIEENPEMEIERYVQPTGLFMTQSCRFSGRRPTVSFGEPKNFTRHIPTAIKRVSRQLINAARVKDWSRQIRRNYQQQNTVMGCSALQAATHANLQVMLVSGTSLQWEWLHLCAFKMGGINGIPQQQGNLVAGTYDCNTAMITLENTIKILALEGHDFYVEITSFQYPGTHVSMEIIYSVECNGIVSKTHFYPMSTDEVIKGEIPIATALFRTFFGLQPSKKKQKP